MASSKSLIQCDTCGRWDEVYDQDIMSIFKTLGGCKFVCHLCAIEAMQQKEVSL